MDLKSRRGVASILGTVVFVLVFMLALGAMAYASGVQSQASQAEEQAQGVAALRSTEALSFSTQSGLEALNGGQGTVYVNHVILRFPNGTVYSFPAVEAIPVGGEAPVEPLIPAGVCSPGAATCLSKYEQIVSGTPAGSSVGVLTSLGNVFWYTYSGAPSGLTEVRFTATSAWGVPQGVTSAYVVCIGGGGGGGGSGGATDSGGISGNGGGGGGGAGSLAQGYVSLVGLQSVTVTVGAGGAGGSPGSGDTDGGSGGDGGQSSFGSLLACGGGQGGGGSYYNYNGAAGASCAPSPAAPGGSGNGIPGGTETESGVAADALQYTVYGGGGGGGSGIYTPPGAGSPSDSLVSGSVFTGLPGASANCATGGGGGSASPFGDGGAGGSAANACGGGEAGGSAATNTGAGGGGAGGSYSPSSSCGTRGGEYGGEGGSGVLLVYYGG
jgi:hypothetical protein